MIVHDCPQGSPAWHALRATHRTASEAAAMFGVSPHMSRAELLCFKKTGIAPEVDPFTQRRYDEGHRVEALARAIVEEVLGEDLYPVTATLDVDGLPLLASLDGLTMDDLCVWENKLWNAETVNHIGLFGEPPIHHVWQMEQQLLVTGADRVVFTCSDGTRDNTVFCTYVSQPERRTALIGGWRQFNRDLVSYVPPWTATPTAVAAEIVSLPALIVSVEGRVVSSNLAGFKAAASAFLANIKTELVTDNDFADAEATVKFCKEGEERLKLVKDQALSQTASIYELFSTIDQISASMAAKRLALDKLVKNRKDHVRTAIVMAAFDKLRQHIRALNERWPSSWVAMPGPAVFAEAIKGKKTVKGLQDSVDAELAQQQIAFSAMADRFSANRAALVIDGTDFHFLFADFSIVGAKPPEDFAALAALRISQHRQIEADQAATKALAEAIPPPPPPVSVYLPTFAIPESLTDETMNITALCARLGFSVSSEFVEHTLHVKPARRDRRSVLYMASQLPQICDALISHLQRVRDPVAA